MHLKMFSFIKLLKQGQVAVPIIVRSGFLAVDTIQAFWAQSFPDFITQEIY